MCHVDNRSANHKASFIFHNAPISIRLAICFLVFINKPNTSEENKYRVSQNLVTWYA